MNNRFESLDILRALAILGMILSGYIAYGGVLPGWMYHAQVPPPLHTFDPLVPGLTWVDLVFPMFLFTMGVAFPFSLRRKIENGGDLKSIGLKLLERFLLLAYFATYYQHIKPYSLSRSPQTTEWFISLAGFFLLIGAFGGYSKFVTKKRFTQYGFLVGSAIFLFILHIALDGYEFKLVRSDIIILILSNVAFIGALCWLFTRDKISDRLLIIIGTVALKLGASVPDSWTQSIWTFDAISWLFRVSFLEYMIIVLSGSIVGDWLFEASKKQVETHQQTKALAIYGSIVAVLLLVGLSLSGLYARWGAITFIIQLAILTSILILVKKKPSVDRQIVIFSSALLVIGMLMEPFEGGVKKDPTTMSYLFISSGLSGFILLFCMDLLKAVPRKSVSLLIESGQNPMAAYVIPAILVVPVFGLLGVDDWMNYLNANQWTGFLKGIIYTVLAMVITSQLTRKNLRLKT